VTRVLFLTASYPVPEQPLLGIFVKEHARAVAAHCELAVVHLDRDPAVRGLPRLVETTGEEWPTIRVRYPSAPTLLSYAGNVIGAVAACRRLRAAGFVPDVIHAHFFLAGVPALLLGRLLRKPVVVTEQWSVFLPDDPTALSPLMLRVARATFTHADVVLPVSRALRDGIRALGVSADFRVVPNVFDAAQFYPAAERNRNGSPQKLIGVGGLYHAKGWEFLLRAVALLAEERRDFHLDIVGDGELRADCEELAAQLDLSELVTFHGWLPKDAVASRVRDADLFVLTSRYDSNPCAVIEALASGVPVVGTAVGGIPDMIGDGMGLLATSENPESIAEQLRTALDSRDSWDHATIARRAIERYGAERVGAELAGIYAEVIARRR
jgi:glycosyltransferase involved in cell wall biosynthesis